MENAVYLLGIIGNGAGKDFSCEVSDLEVYTIYHRDITALVHHGPILGFDRLTKDVVAGELFKYQSVLEEVMKHFSVLPVKFGTWVSDDLEAEKVLNKGYWDIRRMYIEINHCVEFEVVATWVKEKILKEVFISTPEIQELQKRLAGVPDARAYENKVRLGQLVQAELLHRREIFGQRIKDALSIVSTGTATNELLDDFMVLNSAFLIQEGKEEAFDRILQELDREYQGFVNFRCIGPLPAYSFATIEIKKGEFEKVDKARMVLGLKDETTISGIKNAHRSLSRQFHPDMSQSDGKRFEEINRAYRTILDYCMAARSGLDLPSGMEEINYSFREKDVNDAIWVQVLKRKTAPPRVVEVVSAVPEDEQPHTLPRQTEPVSV
jgi:hypothetical protein